MRNNVLRFLSTAIFLVVMISLIVGCAKNADTELPGNINDGTETQSQAEFVFTPTFITIPGEFEYITSISSTADKIFFSVTTRNEENSTYMAKIYSAQTDGTSFTELTNYYPAFFQEDAMGGVSINNIRTDSTGNVFIDEAGYFYTQNPEMEAEETLSYHNLRKLNESGIEYLVDLADFTTDSTWIDSFEIDNEGNIYLYIKGFTDSSIIVLSSDGNESFRIRLTNFNCELLCLPGGSIALIEHDPMLLTLSTINVANKALGESVEVKLSESYYSIFPADSGFDVLLNDGRSLFGLSFETGEKTELLSWDNTAVLVDDLIYIRMFEQDRIMCIERDWNRTTSKNMLELVFLDKVLSTDVPQRTVLTLASIGLNHNLQRAIAQFNRTNQSYRIEVTRYDDPTLLATEITAGKVPDLIDVTGLPYRQYAASGLFKDLYEFIDSDNELARDMFFESILRAVEVNGGLYQVFPTFNIETIIGNSAVLGNEPGWNLDEFRAVILNNPETAIIPFSKTEFVSTAVMLSIDEYVDFENSRANFQRDEFIRLLEYANSLTFDLSIDHFAELFLLASGERVMKQDSLLMFLHIQMYDSLLSGNVVFKGYPTESRNGNLLNLDMGVAITTACVSDEGAWEFVSMLLSKDWQLANIFGFLSNKEAFDISLAAANDFKNRNAAGIAIKPLTQEGIDRIYALIDSLVGAVNVDSALMDIIMEGVNDYFSGRSSAEDTARIIQNRAQTYVSEQSR